MVEVATQTVAKLLSPTLRSFEVNPFRALRLRVNSTTTEASFQSERVLTLARAGLEPDEPDVLPWLPSVQIYELQQAAQIVEEPLARLVEQLFWFDLVNDPEAAKIQSLLIGFNGTELRQYLEREIGLPQPDACDPENEEGVILIAQALNQANIRLLVAASIVNGFLITEDLPRAEPARIEKKSWQTLHGLTVLPEAHQLVGRDLSDNKQINPQHYWQGALKRWAAIISHPWFGHYVSRCISELADDFVSVDDLETIEESLRTRLADLSVREMKFLIMDGSYFLAGGMISAVASSGFESRVLGPALRPVHHLFQSEISELRSLLEPSEENGLADVDAYLKRLEVIKQRWQKIDATGIVGLSHIMDEALERAYLRLRTLDTSPPQWDQLLRKVGKLAGAASLRERVNVFRKDLEEAKRRLCFFCVTGTPDYEKSVVLKGKQETGRTYNYNSTTIHYLVRSALVFRCERCARLHDFLRKTSKIFAWTIVPWLLALFLVNSDIVCLAIILVVTIPFIVFYSSRAILRAVLTPSGHERLGTYHGSEAERSLRTGGYKIDGVDWRSNAVSFLK